MSILRCVSLRRYVPIGVLAVAVALPSLIAADGALFPTPIHLVRRIEDPISHSVQTIDEYCAGNRIVTVNGPKVAITDYDRQQITEIDHKAGTWSVTRFDEIAKARAAVMPHSAQNGIATSVSTSSVPTSTASAPTSASAWKTTSLGAKRAAGSLATETYSIENRASKKSQQHIEIGVDRSVQLSRQALEVLIGSAYPGTHRPEHDQILGVAAGNAGSGGGPRLAGQSVDPTYALPVDQTTVVEEEGQTLTVHNSIVRVGNESAPSEATLIEPGFKRVDSHLVRLAQELHDAETLPSRNTNSRSSDH